MDKPCQIFNCDQSGMPLDPDPPMVIARKGDKHPRFGDQAHFLLAAVLQGMQFLHWLCLTERS